MSQPDIKNLMSFEQHIDLTAEYMDPNLSVNEIVEGVSRLVSVPEAFGVKEINGVRRISAISKLIKSSTDNS